MDPISTEGLTHENLDDLITRTYTLMSEKHKQLMNELKPSIEEYRNSIGQGVTSPLRIPAVKTYHHSTGVHNSFHSSFDSLLNFLNQSRPFWTPTIILYILYRLHQTTIDLRRPFCFTRFRSFWTTQGSFTSSQTRSSILIY